MSFMAVVRAVIFSSQIRSCMEASSEACLASSASLEVWSTCLEISWMLEESCWTAAACCTLPLDRVWASDAMRSDSSDTRSAVR